MRQRLREEPYASAARAAWRTSSAEGVLARFIAGPAFVDVIAQHGLGSINVDDQNFLEFAFARHVGSHRLIDNEVTGLASRLQMATPPVVGAYDPTLLYEERMLGQLHDNATIDPRVESPPRSLVKFGQVVARVSRGQYADALKAWQALERSPRSYGEGALLVEMIARTGGAGLLESLTRIGDPSERELLRGIWLAKRRETPAAVEALEHGFRLAREDAWIRMAIMIGALQTAIELSVRDPIVSRRFAEALAQPFAAEGFREARVRSFVQTSRASRDPKLCVQNLDRLGRLPKESLFLETQAACYRDAGDPRATAAEIELGALLLPSKTFGSNIPSPPGPAKSPPVPPQPAMVLPDAGDEDARSSVARGGGPDASPDAR
jgi:spermidine synthase